jgi:hypothetical protein
MNLLNVLQDFVLGIHPSKCVFVNDSSESIIGGLAHSGRTVPVILVLLIVAYLIYAVFVLKHFEKK